MTAYASKGNASSAKQNSRQKSKLTDREEENWKYYRPKKQGYTTEDDLRNEHPEPTKHIQRVLHAETIHGLVAILKPLVSSRNAIKPWQWYSDH